MISTRILVSGLVVASLGCGGDGTGPSVLSLAGTWTYSESFSSQAPNQGISCNNTGTINLVQSGSTFTGNFNQTGLCTGPGGSEDNSGSGSVTGGQINGSQVSFQVPFCQYQGTASGGSPPNRLNGTSFCTIQISGVNVNFAGTWQASR